MNASAAFEVEALFEPWGPRVNSEYYTGWIGHWGERHNTKTAQVCKPKWNVIILKKKL